MQLAAEQAARAADKVDAEIYRRWVGVDKVWMLYGGMYEHGAGRSDAGMYGDVWRVWMKCGRGVVVWVTPRYRAG